MNERYYNNDSTLISRLAHQAHEECNAIYNERMKTEHATDVIFYDIFNQRFAELIIRECTDICEVIKNEVTSNGSDDYNDGRAMAAEICRNTIYQKFGDNK